MFCASCGQSVISGAQFCAGCGQPVAEASTPAPPPVTAPPPASFEPAFTPQFAPASPYATPFADARQLYTVALAFRQLLLWFAAEFVGGMVVRALALSEGMGSHNPLEPLLVLVLGLGVLVAALMVLVNVYRLASAMGSSVAILWVIGMFIPCLNLLCLVALNSNASSWLNARGVRVGFLGPGPELVAQLRQQAGM